MAIMCEVCKCTVERDTLACGNGCGCCNKPSGSEPIRQQLQAAIQERELWASSDLYEVGYLDALKRVAADMESEGESGLAAELQRWRDYAGALEERLDVAGAGYEDIEAEYFPEYTRPEKLSYYTTCSMTCDENEVETVLEGVGEYFRDGNTLYLNPCHICGESMEVSGWLDECEECGELHYEVDGCESTEEGE